MCKYFNFNGIKYHIKLEKLATLIKNAYKMIPLSFILF